MPESQENMYKTFKQRKSFGECTFVEKATELETEWTGMFTYFWTYKHDCFIPNVGIQLADTLGIQCNNQTWVCRLTNNSGISGQKLIVMEIIFYFCHNQNKS